jgi:hypothetical protein
MSYLSLIYTTFMLEPTTPYCLDMSHVAQEMFLAAKVRRLNIASETIVLEVKCL